MEHEKKQPEEPSPSVSACYEIRFLLHCRDSNPQRGEHPTIRFYHSALRHWDYVPNCLS